MSTSMPTFDDKSDKFEQLKAPKSPAHYIRSEKMNISTDSSGIRMQIFIKSLQVIASQIFPCGTCSKRNHASRTNLTKLHKQLPLLTTIEKGLKKCLHFSDLLTVDITLHRNLRNTSKQTVC